MAVIVGSGVSWETNGLVSVTSGKDSLGMWVIELWYSAGGKVMLRFNTVLERDTEYGKIVVTWKQHQS